MIVIYNLPKLEINTISFFCINAPNCKKLFSDDKVSKQESEEEPESASASVPVPAPAISDTENVSYQEKSNTTQSKKEKKRRKEEKKMQKLKKQQQQGMRGSDLQQDNDSEPEKNNMETLRAQTENLSLEENDKEIIVQSEGKQSLMNNFGPGNEPSIKEVIVEEKLNEKLRNVKSKVQTKKPNSSKEFPATSNSDDVDKVCKNTFNMFY